MQSTLFAWLLDHNQVIFVAMTILATALGAYTRALPGLRELTLTTNGSQLPRMAAELREAGVRRVNISLDSLNPRRFRHLTRHGNLDQVIAGIDAALAAGFEGIKINAVILKGRNMDEVLDLVNFVRERRIDLSGAHPAGRGDISTTGSDKPGFASD